MTYRTYRCPYCNSVVGRATGNPKQIGNPFHTCPYCLGTYTDDFSKEWINMYPLKRFIYYVDKSIALGFLSSIVISAVLMFITQETTMAQGIIMIIIGFFLGLLIMLLHFYIRREKIQEEIKESLERTKSKKYTEKLKKAGYSFYKIEGYDFGIIDDTKADISEGCENSTEKIRPFKDNTFSHH